MKGYHDCYIYKYEVDTENQKITMYIREPHGEDTIELLFSGVIGHVLEHSLPGSSIILGFETPENQSETESFYKYMKDELIEYKRYGLNMDVSTKESFIQELATKKLQCYGLSSSYGLSGWILAQTVSETIISNGETEVS